MIRPVRWRGGAVVIIDQRRLPGRLVYRRCATAEQLARAIETLAVRGAPLIGVAAAYGAVLGVWRSSERTMARDFRQAVARLARTRPTAVNLFWALRRMETAFAAAMAARPGAKRLRQRLLAEAVSIHRDDAARCLAIATHGATLLPRRANVLTHCNAGALATGGIGTALGIITQAHRHGRIGMVYADETRPLLQGARLTAWELRRGRVPVTLICDNMAGALMAQGLVDCVIIGADRIAANGDAANKTGSYGLAALAHLHRIPVYVAAPLSTFDFTVNSGRDIPIESRSADEIRYFQGKAIAPAGIAVRNPAFDVVPHRYISALITESGIIRKPDIRKLRPIKKLLTFFKVNY